MHAPSHSPAREAALAIPDNQKAVMKLKEINDGVASVCNVRPSVVSSVQAETFKQIRLALEKGEKVMIPGFGHFAPREVPGENGAPAKKTIRFKLKVEDEKEAKAKDPKAKEERKAKKAAAAAAGGGEANTAKAAEEADGK
jgi:nucleoid DNA-binding protein